MTSARVPVSVVVLTFNEERNVAACLDSVKAWAARVFVVDSGSVDATLAIARGRGAEVVSHPFETHAKQWQWALATLPIETDWVLGLDADQQVTPELAEQIAGLLREGTDAAGVFVRRRQIFRGKWIRFGGYYPKYLLKLFRHSLAMVDAGDLVDHHFSVSGTTVSLTGDLIEDNHNEAEIAVWTAKHNRYAVLQARQEVAADSGARGSVGAVWQSGRAGPSSQAGLVGAAALRASLPLRLLSLCLAVGIPRRQTGVHLPRPAGVLVPPARGHQRR